MLLEKTRGNLDETERDLLTKAVGKLRRELAPLAEPGPSN
jgi:hypothetical protein